MSRQTFTLNVPKITECVLTTARMLLGAPPTSYPSDLFYSKAFE